MIIPSSRSICDEMIYVKTSGLALCRCFLKMFIESEKIKAVGVNHSFKKFSHKKRETYCTMATECRAGSRETFFFFLS